MRKSWIVIGILSLVLLSLTACAPSQNNTTGYDNETTNAADITENTTTAEDAYVLTPEQLTSDEYILATSLLNNVYKYRISIPCKSADIALKCKYYHNGELTKEDELTSKIDSSDMKATIFLALQSEGKVIMAVRSTDGSERTNDRLDCSSENNVEFFEFISLNDKTEIEPGSEILLLTLRSSVENPDADSAHPESRYEDMLFITFCIYE